MFWTHALFIVLLSADLQAPALAGEDLSCAIGVVACGAEPASVDSDDPASGPAPLTAVDSDNWAPMMIGAPAGVALTDQIYVFQPVAFDPDGDPLEFWISNAPDWAAFDSLTGRLTGTPTVEQAGLTENITISVSDGIYVFELPAFSIEVRAQALGSAVLAWVAPTQNTDGSVLTDLAGYIVRYGSSPDALHMELRIPSPGVAGCELIDLAAGDWYFEVRAYNQAGIESDPSNRVFKSIS